MGNERGKGADMRRTLYSLGTGSGSSGDSRDTIVVFLDADVLTQYFGAHFVYGLAGAVLEGHDFAKASFWRGLGRVKKFVAQPLFSSIDHPALRDLRSLAYPPLSGEVAVRWNSSPRSRSGRCMASKPESISMPVSRLSCRRRQPRIVRPRAPCDENIQKMAFGIIRHLPYAAHRLRIIELKDGARINDRLTASYIDDRGGRKEIDHDLREIKYRPLREIMTV